MSNSGTIRNSGISLVDTMEGQRSITIRPIVLLITFFSVCVYIAKCASIKRDEAERCREIPRAVLARVLGPAFNPRYMSINVPVEDSFSKVGVKYKKRKVELDLSFSVEEDFGDEIEGIPAWNVNFVEGYLQSSSEVEDAAATLPKSRFDRAVIRPGPHLNCEARVKWVDLGVDYFPRFLRTVECTSSDCWYGRYRCRPRAFTVKILKKRSDQCDRSEVNYKTGMEGLPTELRELWVWEERAVNFCCDCAL